MKKVFWIFSICALSLSTAFAQDDNYYPNNQDQSIPPANYSANSQQSIPPADYNANNNGNNYQPAAQPADNNVNSYSDNNAGSDNYNNQPANQSAGNNNGDDYANYDNFHNQLSPYGNWINYPGYGNVWVPNQVPTDFSPYATAGHWVYTDYGWSWVSDYAWGGIPFHYGRWFRDNAYGWMWMPGYQWASAWVTWGNYDNYYCWAPLAPYIGFSAYYRPNPFYWNFCDRVHFCDFHLGLYRGFYGRGDYSGIAARINVINESHTYGNHAYFAGPRVNEVERSVGHSIVPFHGHASQNIAHNNNAQFHEQPNTNQYHGQNYQNHNNVQANHFANNNMQSQSRTQQFNRGSYSSLRANNAPSYQRSNMSTGQRPAQRQNQFSNQNHFAQSNRAPQQNFQRSQPVQRQSERNFASARSGGSGSRGGRR